MYTHQQAGRGQIRGHWCGMSKTWGLGFTVGPGGICADVSQLKLVENNAVMHSCIHRGFSKILSYHECLFI